MQRAESPRKQDRGGGGVISVNAAVSRPDSARRAASVNEPTGDAALCGAAAERELPRETAKEHNCQATWTLATRASPLACSCRINRLVGRRARLWRSQGPCEGKGGGGQAAGSAPPLPTQERASRTWTSWTRGGVFQLSGRVQRGDKCTDSPRGVRVCGPATVRRGKLAFS